MKHIILKTNPHFLKRVKERVGCKRYTKKLLSGYNRGRIFIYQHQLYLLLSDGLLLIPLRKGSECFYPRTLLYNTKNYTDENTYYETVALE